MLDAPAPRVVPSRTTAWRHTRSIDGDDVVSEWQFFEAVWYVALLLMLLPLVLPLTRSKRRGLQQAAVWVLIGGFAFAFYRLGEWLLTGPG